MTIMHRTNKMTVKNIVLAGVLAGAVGLTMGLAAESGCVAHNSACMQACLDQHRTCVTTGQTPVELDRCDQSLIACRRACP